MVEDSTSASALRRKLRQSEPPPMNQPRSRSQANTAKLLAENPVLARMKELEAENARLKRMYADLALENAAIKDVLSRKL